MKGNSCKKGYYYCFTSKKCKKIPMGWHVMPSTGRLMKDSEHSEEETETKKNGNGTSNGSSTPSNGSNGSSVSEGRRWSEKYKRSIDCDNPKGFSQRAHCQGRKVNEAKEKGDHEVSMAHSQLKKTERNIKLLRKALGKKEKNIPAWVQAKITDTEHNMDAAAGYMDEATDGIKSKDYKGRLDKWFDDGGWVQTGGKYDGKPCAKQPGQTTKPFCRDPDDRAAMSKDERERRAKKKRREDPNANRSGEAKIVSASYSNWRDELDQLNEKKDACYHKVKSRYKIWPSAYASGALVKCRKVGAANWGNSTNEGYEFSNWRDDYQPIEIETTDLITADEVIQEKMTDAQMDKRERIVKSMKKNFAGFRKRYGDDAKSVMYATATKQALNAHYDWRAELDEDWQKVNRQDKTDGLSQAAVDAYRRENPGSKLQTAVTEKKPKGKRAERRANFCRRMKGMKSKLTSSKTARDPDSRINKALRRWRCN